MKKIILTSLSTFAALAAFSQGSLLFGNNTSPSSDRHPVYAPQFENPDNMVVGNSSLSSPSGTTVFDGGLVGSGYDFGLFAGPAGATNGVSPGPGPSQLTFITTVTFHSSTNGGLPQGLITSTQVTVAGVPGGSLASYQLVAWNTEGGTVNDWATALAHYNAFDPNGDIGWTPILTTSSVLASGLLIPPATDFTSFSLINDDGPEPSTLALSGLGFAGWLFSRAGKLKLRGGRRPEETQTSPNEKPEART